MNARIVAAAFASIILASCGGGGGGSAVTPINQSPVAPQVVKFTFKIPTKSKQVVRKKMIGGKYVSPATLGLGLSYSSTASTYTNSQLSMPNIAVDLSTCATTAYTTCATNADGSETFTLQAPIPPGTYTFELVTWDCAPVGSPLTFSGNQLSTAIVPLVVTAGGAPQSPNFVLNGVPASVAVSAAPSQSHVSATTSGYVLTGNAPQQFFANALDADGLVITGAGAPTLNVTDSSGTLTSTVNGNMVSLRALKVNSSGASVIFQAVPAASGLPSPVASVSIITDPELWLSQSAGSVTGIWGYHLASPSYNQSATLDFIPSGSMNNSTLVVDQNGDPWITNNSVIQEFAAGVGSLSPTSVSTAITLPGSVSSTVQGTALDANGLLWVADSSYPSGNSSGEVLAYDLSNTTSPKYALTAGLTLSAPQSIAVAPAVAAIPAQLQGAIFVATPQGVDVLTVSGGTLADTYTSVLSGNESAIAIGPDGTVWTYDGSNLNAYSLTMPGSAPVLTPEAALAIVGMNQMATDPGGRAWVLQSSSGGVNAYALSGCPASCLISLSTSIFPGSAYARGVSITP